MEMEHVDPFDDFDNYQKRLKAEGKKLPHAVQFLEKEDSRVGGQA